MKPTEDELMRRLKTVTDNLKAGVPVECTHVRVIETPEGNVLLKRPGIVGQLPEGWETSK